MPSREDVQKALGAIKRVADLEYFFEHLQSAGWIAPLEEEKLFAEPWPPIHEGKYVNFPFWPQAKYLVRMAAVAPEQVMGVIERVPATENVRVHEDFADAAQSMPPSIAVRIVPLAVEWMTSPYKLLLPDKLGRLATHLALGGEVSGALQLVKALLAVQSTPPQEDSYGTMRTAFDRPAGQIETYFYEQVLSRDIPSIRAADPQGTFGVLADALQEAAAIGMPRSPQDDREDWSSMWQPSIEQSDQNHDHDIRPALVRAVTECAEAVINAGTQSLSEIVDGLDARPWKIFSRIALHLGRVFLDRDFELAKQMVFDRARADDSTQFHEYWLLAQAVFPKLDRTDQDALIERLDDDLQREYAEADKAESPEAVEYEKKAARHGLMRSLSLLRDNLPAAAAARLKELEQELEAVERPEFLSYSRPVWVGPTSPKSTAELGSMSDDEVIAYLQAWKPSGKPMEDSPEGLARALSALVTATPARFAEKSLALLALDPTYVRSFLWGLREGLKASRVFGWEPVLGLCSWVVSQGREIPGRVVDDEDDMDPDWGGSRRAIAGLLEDGFAAEVGGVPYGLRDQAWAVLSALTDDPDPTPDLEQRYGGSNMDPMTLSINSVRSIALHAVVHYALWVRRHLEEQEDKGPLQRGFEEMPGVREVLDDHLVVEHDPSQACRAVYGRWFPWLFLLDPGWARLNMSTIFPRAESERPLRNAAWGTYMMYSGIFNNIFEVLRAEYTFAISRIGQEHYGGHHDTEPDQRLVNHIIVAYWRGGIALDDERDLVQQLFAVAPRELRVHALEFIGHTVNDESQQALPDDVRARLQDLLDWRLNREAPWTEKAEELAEFGWWFASGKFSTEWALPRLLTILRSGQQLAARHLVVKRLEVISVDDPISAMEALRWIINTERQGWEMSLWIEEGRQVLKRALKGADATARRQAEDCINLLAAGGNRVFVDLLQG